MILGVDVYAGDRVDYAGLARAGVRFAYIKVSEGADVDGRCREHARCFRSEGVEIGAYAYEYSPREDQATAARVFADIVSSAQIDDLAPAVDFESACSASRQICVPGDVALAHAQELGAEIERLLSTQVIVYTGPGFWDPLPSAGSWLCQRPLWVADYRGKLASEWAPLRAPTVPRGWPGWAAHQYTNGPPHGLSTLDRNVCPDLDAIRWRKVQAWTPIDCRTIQLSPVILRSTHVGAFSAHDTEQADFEHATGCRQQPSLQRSYHAEGHPNATISDARYRRDRTGQGAFYRRSAVPRRDPARRSGGRRSVGVDPPRVRRAWH